MIKNLELLELDPEQISWLKAGARLHQQMSNIQFEVLSADKDAVQVRAIQGYSLSDNYANTTALWDITGNLFRDVIGERFLVCSAVPFKDIAEKAIKEN